MKLLTSITICTVAVVRTEDLLVATHETTLVIAPRSAASTETAIGTAAPAETIAGTIDAAMTARTAIGADAIVTRIAPATATEMWVAADALVAAAIATIARIVGTGGAKTRAHAQSRTTVARDLAPTIVTIAGGTTGTAGTDAVVMTAAATTGTIAHVAEDATEEIVAASSETISATIRTKTRTTMAQRAMTIRMAQGEPAMTMMGPSMVAIASTRAALLVTEA